MSTQTLAAQFIEQFLRRNPMAQNVDLTGLFNQVIELLTEAGDKERGE